MSSTRISRHINAPRAAVYRALLDARAVAKWKAAEGMTCQCTRSTLVPDGQVVEVDEFETKDPALRGEITGGRTPESRS